MTIQKKSRSSNVTLREVARYAGVSAMTVSNVINGRRGAVSAATRERVEDAIAKLNYRLDVAGRSLRLARRFSIGMIIVDPSPRFIADAFTTNIVAGLSNYLNRRGYGLLIQGVTAESFANLSVLRHNQTDALCVMASGTEEQRAEFYHQLATGQGPVVIFQDKVPDYIGDAVSIRQDDRGGAASLARRLIAAGCRRFVFLVEPDIWPALESREIGVQATLEAAQLETSCVTVRSEVAGYDSIQAALAEHVRQRGLPDAIIAGNDQVGIAAINWLQQEGVAVPGDVRVTGFNAFDFWRYTRPTLTTVRSPAYRMGELGGEILLARIEGEQFSERDICLTVSIQEGDSA